MECRAECAERQEKFHRYKAKEQRRYRVQSPKRRAANRQTDTDPRASVRHQVHNRNTYQLHYQNFHRDYAKFFRAFVYLNVLSGVRLKNFKFFQALHAVEELIAHRSVFSPIFGEHFFRVFAHRNNGYGNKRHTADKHKRCSPVDPHAD